MSEPVEQPQDPGQPSEQPQGETQATETTDWKAEARKWEQRAKENRARLDEAQPILEQWNQLEQASKSELERATEQLTRWQSEAEQWRKAAVGSRIEAIAAADFADPSDAIAALADKNYLGVDGQIDEAAIRSDLASVLERKPHWRRASEPTTPVIPRVPAPNHAQGASGPPAANDPAQQFASILRGQLGGG